MTIINIINEAKIQRKHLRGPSTQRIKINQNEYISEFRANQQPNTMIKADKMN